MLPCWHVHDNQLLLYSSSLIPTNTNTRTHTHTQSVYNNAHTQNSRPHTCIHIYTLCCVSITSISLVCVHSCVPVTECQSCVYIHVHCAVYLSVSLCVSLMYITLLAVSYICSTVVELIICT